MIRSTGDDAYEEEADAEEQYVIGGARIILGSFDPITFTERATVPITDLIGSTSAVIDLISGRVVETSTFYPNGATETYRADREVVEMEPTTYLPREPMGFTGKEGDEEVGLVYFGERYLIPRIGRWASPDPLHVHAMGGGEALNSYHYVSGNLLQATDPLGLGDPAEQLAEAAREVRERASGVYERVAPVVAGGGVAAAIGNGVRAGLAAVGGAAVAVAPYIPGAVVLLYPNTAGRETPPPAAVCRSADCRGRRDAMREAEEISRCNGDARCIQAVQERHRARAEGVERGTVEGDGDGVDYGGRPAGRRLSRAQRIEEGNNAAIDEFIAQLGRPVPPRNPREGRAGEGRQSDRLEWEYKTLRPRTRIHRDLIRDRVRDMLGRIQGGVRQQSQARRIMINARATGMTRSEAEAGIADALRHYGAQLRYIGIIGNGYFVEHGEWR